MDIYPQAGRLALFLSSSIPHEVLPTYGERYALTIWYYDRTERTAAITTAQASGTAHQIASYSNQQQLEAKHFIGQLLKDEDEVVTIEELAILREMVEELSDAAVEIVSAVTGAPSAQSFRTGFPLLTVEDLGHMRALFRRMGLQ